jgi:alginate O-acetyltransferase complex protein AlgI
MSPAYLILLMIMAGINYAGALLVEKHSGTGRAKVFLAIDIIITLGILGWFKYVDFFCEIVNSIFGIRGVTVFTNLPEVVLPAGISFYSFQLISYVIDVYRKDVPAEHNYARVLLYTSLFHQCIAGPIVRFKDIADDLKERKTNISSMNEGISRFCIGLAKKTLLANSCGSILDSILPETIYGVTHATVLASWTGGLLYMLQIYLDFSAYSDMAIGLGKMTGFHYKENFNYPYTANSVTDFWRRWHISLGTFFRDYVYIPLGGNRKGLARQLFNMAVVWALTGLWHGASYNFVLWGVYFFVFLAVEKIFLLKVFEKMPKILSGILGWIYTTAVVFFGWILFRFTDFEMLHQILRSMFGMNGNALYNIESRTILMNNIYIIIICVIACTPLVRWLANKLADKAKKSHIAYMRVYNVLNAVLPMALLALSTLSLIGDSYNPFIYYRF